MRRTIKVKEQAALQLEEAFLWYEGQQENLGMAFLEEWESTIELLGESCRWLRKKI